MSLDNTMQTLPVLPLKNTVLFPHMFVPLSVGRPSSVAAVEAALATEEKISSSSPSGRRQRPARSDDLYPIGTRTVKKMAPENGIEMLVQGIERVVLVKIEQTEPYLKARASRCRCRTRPAPRSRRCTAPCSNWPAQVAGAGPAAGADQRPAAGRPGRDPLHWPTCSARCSAWTWPRSRRCWKPPRALEALRLLHGYLTHEVQVLELRNKIASQAQTEMSKRAARVRAAPADAGHPGGAGREEPGEGRGRRAAPAARRGRPARRRAQGGRARADAGWNACRRPRRTIQVTRTYLELVLELPWKKATPRTLDLASARQGPRRGPLRPGGGQGAHPRAPGGAEAEPEGEGADPVLRRPAGRRQDVAGPVDRPRAGPQVRAAEPGRPARRGGAARPPPHLHRRHAGPASSRRSAGPASTTRC